MDRPRPKEAGSGLGLTIVAQLTEAMGGKVSVTARRPTGTRFTVDLPAREPADAEPTARLTGGENRQQPSPDAGSAS